MGNQTKYFSDATTETTAATDRCVDVALRYRLIVAKRK
jgi:hypothetical protein